MPEILETATEEVKKERDIVLRSRGINNPLAVPPPPTQRDLLTTGSGRLAGGAAAADELLECSAELNYTGFTTTKVMTLARNNASKHEGRRNNMGADASMEKRLSPEVLKERYKEAVRFTTGVVFGPGDARLGPEVRDEVIRRRRAREEKAKAVVDNAKKKLRELVWEVEKIKDEMEEPSFRMGVKHLEKLVRWKTRKGDEKLPSKKRADLQQRWDAIKGRESPHISPYNSDDESDADDE